MERLANEGKLSSTPMEAVIPQAEPTLESEAKVIPMNLNEISNEIL
jgi:hypothetical protein